jgi:hypothetical protein
MISTLASAGLKKEKDQQEQEKGNKKLMAEYHHIPYFLFI